MKIDLVGPALAMGFNEAAGYGALALTAMATGFLAQKAAECPCRVRTLSAHLDPILRWTRICP